MEIRIIESDKIFVKEVIICTKTRRGKGIEGSPIRIITEVFDFNGNKIAEYDPFNEETKQLKPDGCNR